MRKITLNRFQLFVIAALPMLAACRGTDKGPAEADFSAPERRAAVQNVLNRSMPEAMADGMVKVAIVRNLTVSSYFRSFLEGCVSEGRSLGFTVDTFLTDGDIEHCRALIEKIAAADYDGLIFSYGSAEFTAAVLAPALEKGLKIVTCDALPYKDGNPANGILDGVTSTSQNDRELARLSLDAIMRAAEAKGTPKPVNVIRVWFGPGVPWLDRRQAVYDQFIAEGKITEAALISPLDFAFSVEGTREALTAALPRFPPGSVDAIWAPTGDFASGGIFALNEAERKDIVLSSVDISNDSMKLMMKNSEVWLGAAGLDPALIGIANMRILAAKLAGEIIADEYLFDVLFVPTAQLNSTILMANIAGTVEGWGMETGIFDHYPWMTELKEAAGKRRDIARRTAFP